MCKMIHFKDGKYIADIKYKYIQNIVKQAEQCKHINRIMLFGSSLEERCTDKSDIDIAVFGDKTREKYLVSKEFKDFHRRVFRYDMDQEYDILYFVDGKKYDGMIMQNIHNGLEIYRRAGA